MPHEPLVSIVIDNFNYDRFLRDSIDSALAQTWTNSEVIVVDDGSTDDSRRVIGEYAGRVRTIFKENGGQASAFNAGFALSSGTVVVFLDSDDMLIPTALERAVPFFEDPEVVKVHWPMKLVDSRGNDTGRLFPSSRLPEGDLREHVFRVGPTNLLSAPSGGTAWSRRFLERTFPLPPSLYTNGCDTFLFEAAPFFGPVRFLREPQSCYRQHGTNDHLMRLGDKVDRELRFYEHYSRFLARYCESIGVPVDLAEWERNSWWHRHRSVVTRLAELGESGAPLILVDDATLEQGPIGDHPRWSLISRDGEYWGAPPDDETAIRELERQRQRGAAHVAFAWMAFWWLDHYRQFRDHLRRNFPVVVEDRDLIVFCLHGNDSGRATSVDSGGARKES